MRYKGVFYQNQELHAFPFDKQELQIRIAITHQYDWPKALGKERNGHACEKTSWFGICYSNDFKIKDDVQEEFLYYVSEGSGRRYPLYLTTVEVSRNSKFYVLNVGVFVWVLAVLGAAVNGTEAHPDDLLPRMTYILSIVLSHAMFKFILADKKPKVINATTATVATAAK